MGNICRSPTGEAMMRALIDSKQLGDQIQVDSAGTIGYHSGAPADRRMRAAAAQRNLTINTRARKVTAEDIDAFDLIIAMDRENLRDLESLAGGAQSHIKLLSEYLDDSWPSDVPDPYYGGDEGFEYVLDMVAAACEPILASAELSR